jgi:hypothetical protein
MSIRVYVNQDDIRSAKRRNGFNNPVAKTLKRKLHKRVYVAKDKVYIFNTDRPTKILRLSDAVREKIVNFDKTKEFETGHLRFSNQA